MKDAIKVRIAGIEIAGKLGRTVDLNGAEDFLKRHRTEGDTVVVGLIIGKKLVLETTKGGHHTPIKPWAHGNEDSSRRKLLINAELSQHMFAPQLFEGEGAQHWAVGIDEETAAPGDFVIAIAETSGWAGHIFGVFGLDEDDGRFTLGCNDTNGEVEGGAIIKETG